MTGAEAGKYELMFQNPSQLSPNLSAKFWRDQKMQLFFPEKNSVTLFLTFGRALLMNFGVT